MKHTLLLALLFVVFNSAAQLPEIIKAHEQEINEGIEQQKVTVIFNKQVDEKVALELLSELGFEKYYKLPAPDVYIAYPKWGITDIKQFYALKNQLELNGAIQAVMPYFKTKRGGSTGILPKVFFTWEKEPISGLIKKAGLGEFELTDYKYNPNIKVIESNKAFELAIWLNQQKGIKWAEPDYLLNPIVTSNDTYYSRQWAHKNDGLPLQGNGLIDADMDVDSAWTISRGDSSVKVAVLDSGVDTAHVDLKANLLPGYDAVSHITKGYPTPNFSSDGHGTACAGIIGAVADNNIGVAGVAPGCKIIPIRTFYYVDTLGLGVIPYSTASIFADAINWAWQNDADIMSNSWGLDDITIQLLPGDPAIVEDAIAQGIAQGRSGKGVAMFFSSGNEDYSPIWPSRLAKTIAVNATSMCDERKFVGSCDNETWWTGSWGEPLDFGAPGVKIFTTDMTDTMGYHISDYYAKFNGTSAACPNAAAVGALLLSVNPNFSYFDIQYIMARTADKVGGYNYNVPKFQGMWSAELGFGRVNAYQALRYAQAYNVGLNESDRFDFKLYPNPTQNYVNIECDNCKKASLYDIRGKRLLQQPITGRFSQLNLSHLSKGLYFIEINGQLSKIVLF